MDPLTGIALADGLVTLLEKVIPEIEAAVKRGEIAPEVQTKLMARIDALRPGGTAFTGPEWQMSATTAT